MNKDAELFYLDKFRENFINFPHGDVCPDESPDFLIKSPAGIVGVEVTHFYRQMSSDTQPPLQQRESVRHKIISLAKSIYDSKGFPSVFVSVHFDLNFHCRKSDIQPIAERLVELAELSLSGLTEEKKEKIWRIYEIQLNGVLLLSVTKWKMEKSYWNAPLASFVPTVNSQQIQDILDEKNTRCADYRKKCDEVWLIIVMNRFSASSYSMIPEGIAERDYAHEFDSAFLFFYDYPDKQKPPLILKKSQIADSLQHHNNQPAVSGTVSERPEK